MRDKRDDLRNAGSEVMHRSHPLCLRVSLGAHSVYFAPNRSSSSLLSLCECGRLSVAYVQYDGSRLHVLVRTRINIRLSGLLLESHTQG